MTKQDVMTALNEVADKHKGNIFRVLTGDLVENALKSSVGHNYDIEIADPAIQKKDMIDVLTKTNKHLYGEQTWKKLKVNDENIKTFNDVLVVGVEGNHEYRTRKASGQWLSREIHEPSKVLDMGFGGIIELTIFNKKLKMEKTYRIYVAHRPSKTDATSQEAILRAFKKKQSTFPGIDVIIFGHFHRRFISADGYFDSREDEFKKILYLINPSPLRDMEYPDEEGYPPLRTGYYVNAFLPLDPQSQCYGIV